MPNITGGEIVIILLVALIVLGPQRLPEAARQVSKAFREFRRVQNTVQSEIRATLDAAGEPIRESTKPVTETVDLLRTGGADATPQADAGGPLTQQPIAAPAAEPVPNGHDASDPVAVPADPADPAAATAVPADHAAATADADPPAEPSPAAPATGSTATFRPRENGAARPATAAEWGEAPLHDEP